MKSKVLTSIFVTVALIGFISWKLVTNKQIIDKNAKLSMIINSVVPVMIDQPKYMNLNDIITVNGRIDSKAEVAIYSKAQGVVIRKLKKAGDVVRRGTVIAQLENKVIRENLRIAELDLSKAQKDVDRFRNLVSIGAITIRELEDAQIALRNSESRIAELNDQLANTTIVAPVSGILNKDYFEEGTLLTIGSNVADVVDDKDLKMVVNVTAKEMLKLKKGQKVTITTEVYPNSTFLGIIDAISPKSNDQYYYSVEVIINNSQLHPGMFATAVISAEKSNRNVLAISREAIVGGLKSPYVYVVRDSKAYKVPVQVGASNDKYIGIYNGISVNDLVVISGQINLVDGSDVSILNQTKK